LIFFQVLNTIKIFERMYPGGIALFLFDQSLAHNAFANDALVANQMNVGPGGKNAKPMHETHIPMDNPSPELRGKVQSMVYPPGHADAGKLKGMRNVLDERAYWSHWIEALGDTLLGCALSANSQRKLEQKPRKLRVNRWSKILYFIDR
jgi:hypothetical protein